MTDSDIYGGGTDTECLGSFETKEEAAAVAKKDMSGWGGDCADEVEERGPNEGEFSEIYEVHALLEEGEEIWTYVQEYDVPLSAREIASIAAEKAQAEAAMLLEPRTMTVYRVVRE